MTPFEQHQPDMDAQVRNHLGDSISIVFRNGTTLIVPGWVFRDADQPGVEGLNSQSGMWHCKIDCDVLPAGPATISRLTHRRLDGPYKPAVDTIAGGDGSAWVFDLQKAR